MSDYHDMLHCNHCGVLYEPDFTVTGRMVPHCLDIPWHSLPFDTIPGGKLKYDVVED